MTSSNDIKINENEIKCFNYSEFEGIIEIDKGQIGVIHRADWTKRDIRVLLKRLRSKEFIQEVQVIFLYLCY